MGLINYHQKCRACGHANLDSFFNLGEHYLHGLFVFPDFQPPTAKVPTELVRCETESGGCGLVQLRHSIDPDILYSRYGYRSSTNATMRAHLTDIALKVENEWVSVNKQNNPVCLDIGCNDGFLLRQLSPNLQKVGIDPCDIGNSISGIENFKFINQCYPSVDLTQKFDIITMIACFYDLNNPVEVAQSLSQQLNEKGILIIEVSYWPDKMQQNAIDEVCHEHVCFYNYQNLDYIFGKVGLSIFNVKKNSINGGSIQIWLTQTEHVNRYANSEYKHNIQQVKFDEFNRRLDSGVTYASFLINCDNLKRKIVTEIRKIKNQKKTIHLYGASTKGNVLLQYLGLNHEDIPFAAERSKEKHGGTTLGTNIRMISEEDSRALRPDYYFVPIWSFKDEIIKREQSFLNGGGKLIFPLPELTIIGQ